MVNSYKLVDDSEYCQSWGDPREKTVEDTHNAPSIGDTIADIGESLGDAVTDFGTFVGNAIADGASSLGGLFDFTPSQTEEQQPIPPKKKKIEKKKGRGQSR